MAFFIKCNVFAQTSSNLGQKAPKMITPVPGKKKQASKLFVF
jgi:hypothetical protein